MNFSLAQLKSPSIEIADDKLIKLKFVMNFSLVQLKSLLDNSRRQTNQALIRDELFPGTVEITA